MLAPRNRRRAASIARARPSAARPAPSASSTSGGTTYQWKNGSRIWRYATIAITGQTASRSQRRRNGSSARPAAATARNVVKPGCGRGGNQAVGCVVSDSSQKSMSEPSARQSPLIRCACLAARVSGSGEPTTIHSAPNHAASTAADTASRTSGTRRSRQTCAPSDDGEHQQAVRPQHRRRHAAGRRQARPIEDEQRGRPQRQRRLRHHLAAERLERERIHHEHQPGDARRRAWTRGACRTSRTPRRRPPGRGRRAPR